MLIIIALKPTSGLSACLNNGEGVLETSVLPAGEDHVCGFFGDHDDRGIGIA